MNNSAKIESITQVVEEPDDFAAVLGVDIRQSGFDPGGHMLSTALPHTFSALHLPMQGYFSRLGLITAHCPHFCFVRSQN